MLKLLYGTHAEHTEVGEFEKASQIRKYIKREIVQINLDPRYIRIVGNGENKCFIDFGSYINFYFVEGLKTDLSEFVKEFYEE